VVAWKVLADQSFAEEVRKAFKPWSYNLIIFFIALILQVGHTLRSSSFLAHFSSFSSTYPTFRFHHLSIPQLVYSRLTGPGSYDHITTIHHAGIYCILAHTVSICCTWTPILLSSPLWIIWVFMHVSADIWWEVRIVSCDTLLQNSAYQLSPIYIETHWGSKVRLILSSQLTLDTLNTVFTCVTERKKLFYTTIYRHLRRIGASWYFHTTFIWEVTSSWCCVWFTPIQKDVLVAVVLLCLSNCMDGSGISPCSAIYTVWFSIYCFPKRVL
jgi:hypothetical protein